VKPAVCLVVSSPFTLNAFLGAHLAALARDFRVGMIVNLADESIEPRVPPGVELIPVRIRRQIDLVHDLAALVALWRLFRARRFASVHSLSPKAGLLAMLAARLAGIPVRLHTFTGQVWATRRGASRWLFKALDRIMARAATRVFADSASQCDFLVEQGIVSRARIGVLGAGSVSGVDTVRFRPDAAARGRIRAALGVEEDAVLVLYVGRMKVEKGIPELLEALSEVRRHHPGVRLLLVGPDEDRLFAEGAPPGTIVVGYTNEVPGYMAAAEVLVLPSHREGFGSVIIEAAACGIPSVASRIYGLTDAVVDGVTGVLHAPRDPGAIAASLARLLEDPEARRRMGEAARARALAEFDQAAVTQAWCAYYRGILGGGAA
jgi:glycosyltransferase involved in cell wall biosynthesis